MRCGLHLVGALLAATAVVTAAPAQETTAKGSLSDAHRLIADGCLYEAVATLKAGLEASPKDSAAQKLLAVTLFRVREYAGAAAYATTVLSDTPDDAEARRVLSLAVLLSDADLDPENAPALLERARLCAAGGLYGLAADLYARYLERVSHDHGARREYARMLGWSGRSPLAAQQYRVCLEATPHDRGLRLEMARLMNQSGMHAAAAREFRGLLEADSGNTEVRMDLLRALAWDGEDAPGAALLPDLAADAKNLGPADLAFAADQAARLSRPKEEKALLEELDRRDVKPAGLRARLDLLTGAGADETADAPDGTRFPAIRRELVNLWRARYADLSARAGSWTSIHRADLHSATAAGLLLERTGDGAGAREHYGRVNEVKAVPLLRERRAFLEKAGNDDRGDGA